MRTVTQDLLAAKSLIETPDRWIRGSLRERDFMGCRYCTLGALSEATSVFPEADEHYNLAYAALQAQLPNYPSSGSIAWFNDDPRTTHTDVLGLFDRAIRSTQETA